MILTPDQKQRVLQRNSQGFFGNMFEIAEELFPKDQYAGGLEAIRAFLYDYDDLDIDDEGNVYGLSDYGDEEDDPD